MATELARKLGDIKQYHTKIPSSAIEELSEQIFGILGGVAAILEHYIENPRYLKFTMVNELHELLKNTKHKHAREQLEKRKRRTKTVSLNTSALPQSTTTFAHTPRSRPKRPQSARNMAPPMKKMSVSKSAEFKKSKRMKRRESHSSHKSMGNMLRSRKQKQRMHKSDALNNYHRSPETEESENEIDIDKVIKRKQREKRKRNLIKNRIVHKKYDHDAANEQIYSEIEDEEECDAITHIKKHRKRKKSKYEQEETLYEEEIEQNEEEEEEHNTDRRRRGRRKRRKKHFDEEANDKIVIKVRSKSHTTGQRHRRYSISEYTDWDTDDDMNEMNNSVEYFRNLEKKYKKKKRKRKKKKKKEKMMKLKRMAMQKMKSERAERKSKVFDQVLQTLDVSDEENKNKKVFDLNGHSTQEQKEENIENKGQQSKLSEIEAAVEAAAIEDNEESIVDDKNDIVVAKSDDKKVEVETTEAVSNDGDKDVSIAVTDSPQKKTPNMDSPEFLAYFEKFIMENSVYVAAEMQGLESAVDDDDESDHSDEEDYAMSSDESDGSK